MNDRLEALRQSYLSKHARLEGLLQLTNELDEAICNALPNPIQAESLAFVHYQVANTEAILVNRRQVLAQEKLKMTESVKELKDLRSDADNFLNQYNKMSECVAERLDVLSNHLTSIENEVNSYQERLAMAVAEQRTLQQEEQEPAAAQEPTMCASERQLSLLRKLIGATQIERKEIERSLLITEAAQKRLISIRSANKS